MATITAAISAYAASHLAALVGASAVSRTGIIKIALKGVRAYVGRRKERKAAKAAADLGEWLKKNPVDELPKAKNTRRRKSAKAK